MASSSPERRIDGHAVRRAILWGGLACGVLDISYALMSRALKGGSPVQLLQGIASALLGPAFKGGAATAALGLVMHFCVAFVLALIFYRFARKFPILLVHSVPTGLIYGAVIYVVMFWGVIMLCGCIRSLYLPNVTIGPLPLSLQGVVVHMLCVGLPIALAARWALLRKPDSATAN